MKKRNEKNKAISQNMIMKKEIQDKELMIKPIIYLYNDKENNIYKDKAST